jgi:hypothetical protein
MKKAFYMMALGTIVILMSSCSSISKSGVVAPVYTYVSPTKEIKCDVELDNSKQVTGQAHQWYFAGIRITGGNNYFENLNQQRSVLGGRVSKAQSCAMYDALEEGHYDMLVNPQYYNVTHSYLFGLIKHYSITVKGYGAKISNIHQE